MKNIILSFDDGRKDNYECAYALLKKHGLTGSFHITTGFVDGSAAKDFEAMSVNEVRKIAAAGMDVSSHGDRHSNTEEDLRASLGKLKAWDIPGLNTVLFSSPSSDIYEKNIGQYADMLRDNNIRYVRSGVHVKRNGPLYIAGSLAEKWTGSKMLFYWLNKNNIMNTALIRGA